MEVKSPNPEKVKRLFKSLGEKAMQRLMGETFEKDLRVSSLGSELLEARRAGNYDEVRSSKAENPDIPLDVLQRAKALAFMVELT